MQTTLNLRSKVIVIGDPAVGKSALCQMFHSNGAQYPKNYATTLGCDFLVKVVNIPDANASVELFLFDTAGQGIFKDMFPKFNCAFWLDQVQKARPDRRLPGVLVANKIDLEDRIVVHAGMGAEFAEANSLEFFQCSAAKNMDVDIPFNFLAAQFYKSYEDKLELLSNM